jgi:hypothetical protein
MDFDFLYRANQHAIELVFLVLMVVVGEIGFRRGRHASASMSAKTRGQVAVIEGSLLGVVGLLLGFTMSMAVTRYEARKQLVLQEANALGTSWLRTQLLPAPDNAAIAELLREYVDVRLDYAKAAGDLGSLEAVRRRAQGLQTEFWGRAVRYNKVDPSPVRSGMLLASLNDVIDLEGARWMAYFNHVPSSVIFVDAAVSWFAALLVGYAYGMEGKRQVFSMWLLSLAIALVLGVIIDLDRPREGFIRVSQQPMLDLQKQLHAAGPVSSLR